ncbi:MAG TPA: DUF2272 domain-containing protein [Lysobacter sp.]|jgi:hypothetical protein|nr:DUF2272 domain-containing protein [Lysobacter sp.]
MVSECGWKVLQGLIGLLLSIGAQAGPVCSYILQSPPSYAARIAAVACNENALWFGPFIDGDGRLASITVSESEGIHLQDGVTPAWRRVADYWKGSGLLWQMSGFPGASDCSYGEGGHLQEASCRAFLTDTPWSAVFVSFVMNRAAVPGFHGSASHVDYVRDAYLHPEASPYLFSDPDTTAPTAGDLLCFARMRNVVGYQGLRYFLSNHSAEGLNMHCDIVVAASPGGDSKLYLVGGNVLQGVTMRVLPLNRNGMIWGLPHRTDLVADCRPGNETACSFNRQDWVALLKLKSLPTPIGPMSLPPTAPAGCCTQCPLPMPPDMQRCPAPPQEIDPPLQSTNNGG